MSRAQVRWSLHSASAVGRQGEYGGSRFVSHRIVLGFRVSMAGVVETALELHNGTVIDLASHQFASRMALVG